MKKTDDAKKKLQQYIAELEKSHAALRESEERHRIISELTTDYMCIVGVDAGGGAKMLWASDSMKKMTGRDVADAMTIDQWRETIHPLDRERFLEFVRRTFTSAETGEFECRSVSKTGSERSIRILVKPQRDEKGAVRAVYVGVKDISDRTKAEDLLRQSAGEWAATFDAIKDPIILLDDRQFIKRCNTAFAALVGKKPEELRGRACHEVVHGLKDPIDECPFVRMSNSGRRESKELSISGRAFTVLTDPIKDGHGDLMGAVHIMSDVTDQKNMEKEKALVEEELRQALKMEAIGRLAGGVAHDFNNMLAGIMGNAELLKLQSGGDPVSAGYIDKIMVAAEHAAKLTGQLLAFARKGRQQLVPLDLHKLIAETVEILANAVGKRIRIEQYFNARLFTVRGDASQLENALVNLSLNARDAMPKGGRLVFTTDTVEMDQRRIEGSRMKIMSGTYIRVRVTDTGIGMPPEVQQHLFEPFFTTKEPGKGTGLGLAGVYGSIKNHGGAIEVSSEPGHGSCFSLYLPVEDRDGESAAGTGSMDEGSPR